MFDPGSYCRELEAYLCRKNDGHLVRIVGPAFETVCGWAEQGIPLKVAFQGIDRYFERYYAKGPRRRPVRIEFCEADVLDAFDAWRRAVGLVTASGGAGSPPPAPPTLPAHLQRVLQKLTTVRATTGDEQMMTVVDKAIDAVESLRARARTARGDSRAALLERLASIDAELMTAAHEAADHAVLSAASREAEEELEGFAPRMTRDAHARAVAAARERLLRARLGLPRITYQD
jgi:hypothetical protein